MKLMIQFARDGRRVVVTAPEYTAGRLTHAGGQETGHVIWPAHGGPGWFGAPHYGIAPEIGPEGPLGAAPYAHVRDALKALEAHLQETRA